MRFGVDPPLIFINLEGVNLCRHGCISIITIMVREIGHPNQVYLVDVHILGHLAFETTIEGGINGTTLKHALESPTIPKVFFDVRNDSGSVYIGLGTRWLCIPRLASREYYYEIG
jgi:exonuclease 3'-5' domain-containing protein 1